MNPTAQSRLSTAETANLWNIYLIESLLIPYKEHLIRTCQSQEIRQVLERAQIMSIEYVKAIEKIYEKEGHVIPTAFSDKDVDPEAPPLYTDSYSLQFIHQMSRLGLGIIPQALGLSTRADVLELLGKAHLDYLELYKHTLRLSVDKGVYPWSGIVPVPEHAEVVDSPQYLAGWFGKQRPLNALEIMHLYDNLVRNMISKTLLLGFSQVARIKEIREHMLKGVQIANGIISDLGNRLLHENVNFPASLDSNVLKTTTPPYSDRLMLQMVNIMGGGSIGLYGMALGATARRDIGKKFMVLMKDALQYSEDGIRLMIEMGWMEKPPGSVDNKSFSNV